jgi:hypothetical protein
LLPLRADTNPPRLTVFEQLQKNLNNIDLLLTLDYDFLSAVKLLEHWLNQYQAKKTKTPPQS